jgi:DNA-binding GntR family transcriptional regulator
MSIYQLIKEAILFGDFEPGQKLTEEYLAEKFNKSRTPIREAINKLSGEGLIVSEKNKGMTIKNFTLKEVKQIYDLRVILEGRAVAQAAVFRTEQDLENLKKENDLFLNAIESKGQDKKQQVMKLTEHNNNFHEILLKAGNNSYLEFLVSNIIFIPLIYRTFYSFDISYYKESYLDHLMIIKAVEQQEADRAEVAMKEHIYVGRDRSLLYFKEYFKDE